LPVKPIRSLSLMFWNTWTPPASLVVLSRLFKLIPLDLDFIFVIMACLFSANLLAASTSSWFSSVSAELILSIRVCNVNESSLSKSFSINLESSDIKVSPSTSSLIILSTIVFKVLFSLVSVSSSVSWMFSLYKESAMFWESITNWSSNFKFCFCFRRLLKKSL